MWCTEVDPPQLTSLYFDYLPLKFTVSVHCVTHRSSSHSGVDGTPSRDRPRLQVKAQNRKETERRVRLEFAPSPLSITDLVGGWPTVTCCVRQGR